MLKNVEKCKTICYSILKGDKKQILNGTKYHLKVLGNERKLAFVHIEN